MQVRQVEGREFSDQVPVLRADAYGVTLVDPPEREGRGDTDTRATGADLLGHRPGDLDREPGPVLDRPAIRAGAVVRVRGEELVQQVPVSAVDLHPVRPRGDRGCRGVAKPAIVAWMSSTLSSPRHRGLLRPGRGQHFLLGGDSRQGPLADGDAGCCPGETSAPHASAG